MLLDEQQKIGLFYHIYGNTLNVRCYFRFTYLYPDTET